MRHCETIVAAFLTVVALTPASSQMIDGKTPKGIDYRFERVARGENVAVYFAWRYGGEDDAKDRSLISYVVPSLTSGAGGESKDAIDRKLRELQVTFGTYSPLERTIGAYVTFERPQLDQVASLLVVLSQKVTGEGI
jgi:hypothetical protein